MIDTWVQSVLAVHRSLSAEDQGTAAPWNVSTLVRSVRDFGNAQQWLWCVAAIAITQELIFCAEDGGIDPAGVAKDRDLRVQVDALRTLRNVVFHPALQLPKGDKPPAMQDLIKLLEADDDFDVVILADELPHAWARVAEKPVAMFALRKLGSAGDLFITKKRLLPRN